MPAWECAANPSGADTPVNAGRLLAGYPSAGSQRAQFSRSRGAVHGSVTSRLAPIATLALPSQKGSLLGLRENQDRLPGGCTVERRTSVAMPKPIESKRK